MTFQDKFCQSRVKSSSSRHLLEAGYKISVVLGSDESRILITSAHVIKCLAHTEFQSGSRRLATVAGGCRVGPGVTECI